MTEPGPQTLNAPGPNRPGHETVKPPLGQMNPSWTTAVPVAVLVGIAMRSRPISCPDCTLPLTTFRGQKVVSRPPSGSMLYVGVTIPWHQVTAEPVGEVTVTVISEPVRSEEHTSELQSPCNLVCRLLLEKKKSIKHNL